MYYYLEQQQLVVLWERPKERKVLAELDRLGDVQLRQVERLNQIGHLTDHLEGALLEEAGHLGGLLNGRYLLALPVGEDKSGGVQLGGGQLKLTAACS